MAFIFVLQNVVKYSLHKNLSKMSVCIFIQCIISKDYKGNKCFPPGTNH